MSDCLAARAVDVLTTADALEKSAKSRAHAGAWFEARAAGRPLPIGRAEPPPRPARPARPELLAPREMPRRRPGTAQGRKALLHAVAHIELNAVDLHWDIVARFTDTPMPPDFYDDWVRTADEEARHFRLLHDCLTARGSCYGELPAHAGMWRAAEDTADDLLARLAIVPMILEARGLDVTPPMIEIFRKADEADAVAALETIYAEEVGHVAHGAKWFHVLCDRDGLDPTATFHALKRRHFHGALKPPFNDEKRAEAGIPPDFYWPLAE
ncbi:ferritin-like domain-containing protein [Zavarzinia compransoris]|uniref:ferritin-like domain-containing protein n=1 Tax=Zavarzinia marina TaxID=2911065 RepID=UPI001F24D0BD|nr:ferritin-like domain-containing protein [Zavarzinia marina]MCF4167207.1 ferritin-like domain-containing protein [Zavarzinia marina]